MEKESSNKIDVTDGDYKGYRDKGGTLKKHDYKIAELFLRETSETAEKRAPNTARTAQIKNESERAGISVSPKEIELYCLLRDQMRSNEDETRNKEGGRSAQQLSDQELVAEILLLTGRTDDLQKFREYFNNIFKGKQ